MAPARPSASALPSASADSLASADSSASGLSSLPALSSFPGALSLRAHRSLPHRRACPAPAVQAPANQKPSRTRIPRRAAWESAFSGTHSPPFARDRAESSRSGYRGTPDKVRSAPHPTGRPSPRRAHRKSAGSSSRSSCSARTAGAAAAADSGSPAPRPRAPATDAPAHPRWTRSIPAIARASMYGCRTHRRVPARLPTVHGLPRRTACRR